MRKKRFTGAMFDWFFLHDTNEQHPPRSPLSFKCAAVLLSFQLPLHKILNLSTVNEDRKKARQAYESNEDG